MRVTWKDKLLGSYIFPQAGLQSFVSECFVFTVKPQTGRQVACIPFNFCIGHVLLNLFTHNSPSPCPKCIFEYASVS